jgi:hypothetical protein
MMTVPLLIKKMLLGAGLNAGPVSSSSSPEGFCKTNFWAADNMNQPKSAKQSLVLAKTGG